MMASPENILSIISDFSTAFVTRQTHRESRMKNTGHVKDINLHRFSLGWQR